jgi:hypothetical protein
MDLIDLIDLLIFTLSSLTINCCENYFEIVWELFLLTAAGDLGDC